MGFLSIGDISRLGIKTKGDNVLISDKCSIYGKPGDIIIGDNVRIDDFCILSGKITLGNNIHIGAYCGLYGKFGIEMSDYTGLSPRCTIFSASDDFSGNYLISPMNPEKYTNVRGGLVWLQKYVQIGAGTIIMPNVVLGEGSAIGAMSFVKHTIATWEIHAGNPLRYMGSRSKKVIDLAFAIEHEL
jgi:acetyltransferase-like isoleucine patch superfamily enzyme